MATIIQSPESATIDSNTVTQLVGLCYFDPETESLLELDKLPDTFLSVEPNSFAMRKFYMVMSPDENVDYAQISLVLQDSNSSSYSVKVIISEDEPPFDAYSILPSFNSFGVNNPPRGDFMSVWLLIENIAKVNEIVNIGIELEYE